MNQMSILKFGKMNGIIERIQNLVNERRVTAVSVEDALQILEGTVFNGKRGQSKSYYE